MYAVAHVGLDCVSGTLPIARVPWWQWAHSPRQMQTGTFSRTAVFLSGVVFAFPKAVSCQLQQPTGLRPCSQQTTDTACSAGRLRLKRSTHSPHNLEGLHCASSLLSVTGSELNPGADRGSGKDGGYVCMKLGKCETMKNRSRSGIWATRVLATCEMNPWPRGLEDLVRVVGTPAGSGWGSQTWLPCAWLWASEVVVPPCPWWWASMAPGAWSPQGDQHPADGVPGAVTAICFLPAGSPTAACLGFPSPYHCHSSSSY